MGEPPVMKEKIFTSFLNRNAANTLIEVIRITSEYKAAVKIRNGCAK